MVVSIPASDENDRVTLPMRELTQQFHSLSAEKKRLVHLELCEQALKQWSSFASSQWFITYVETACGTTQTVDKYLPIDALRSAHKGRDMTGVDSRYREPITAMQDGDLAFPAPIEFAPEPARLAGRTVCQ